MRRGGVRPGAENICFALFFAVVAAAGLYVSSGRADRLLSDMAELTAMPAGAHGLALWISSASLVALAALASKKARRPAGLVRPPGGLFFIDMRGDHGPSAD